MDRQIRKFFLFERASYVVVSCGFLFFEKRFKNFFLHFLKKNSNFSCFFYLEKKFYKTNSSRKTTRDCPSNKKMYPNPFIHSRVTALWKWVKYPFVCARLFSRTDGRILKKKIVRKSITCSCAMWISFFEKSSKKFFLHFFEHFFYTFFWKKCLLSVDEQI